MTTKKWTRRDDQALAAQIEAERYVREHVTPAVARLLGVDPDDLHAIVRVHRPCTHWRCRWDRFKDRFGHLLLPVVAVVLSTAALIATVLIGGPA